jgi:DNA uptake protein ComE-like DNA-binding protein
MILAKEQRRAAVLLFSVALVAWFIVAVWPSRQKDLPEPQPSAPKRSWEARKDSMRRADSLRYAQWAAEREQRYDSFRVADSLRRAEWKTERQQKWDSIRVADSLWRDSVGWKYAARHAKKDTVLDLNHCDTTELQYIRGIGRYTAVQIVQYRERLGGFYSPEQLTDEVFGKLSLDTLLHHFTTDAKDITPLRINSCDISTLQRHPYLRYEQAKAIYNLRRKQLRLTSLEDLRALPELSDSDLQRITPYLCFE